MESPSKVSRKVRFTLPVSESEHNIRTIDIDLSKIGQRASTPSAIFSLIPPIVDEHKVHGTTRYINGVLKFCPSEYQPVVPVIPPPPLPPKVESKRENKFKAITILKPCIKGSPKQTSTTTTTVPSPSKRIPKLNLSKKLNSFIGAKRMQKSSRDASATASSHRHDDTKKVKLKAKSNFRSHAVIFSPSSYLNQKHVVIARQPSPARPPRRRRRAPARPITKLPNLLSVPLTYESPDALGLLVDHLSLSDVTANNCEPSCDYDYIPQTPAALRGNVDAFNENRLPVDFQNLPRMKNFLISSDKNLSNFKQFVERWRCVRKASNQKLNNHNHHILTTTTTSSGSQQAVAVAAANRWTVHSSIFKQSDGKRLVSLSILSVFFFFVIDISFVTPLFYNNFWLNFTCAIFHVISFGKLFKSSTTKYIIIKVKNKSVNNKFAANK